MSAETNDIVCEIKVASRLPEIRTKNEITSKSNQNIRGRTLREISILVVRGRVILNELLSSKLYSSNCLYIFDK